MPENLYYERGRQFLSWRELLNSHARMIGQPTFKPSKRWYQFRRWFKPDEALIMRRPEGPSFYWGGFLLPWSEATTHFLVLGATGSGKSLLFLNLMEGVLPQLNKLPDHRAFIYDAKCELLPRLIAMGLNPMIFDPYDERSVGWDLAADIRTPAEAQQLAKSMVPSVEDGKDSFWINSTRIVLAAVVESFAFFAPGRWTLRDVLLTMRSPDRITDLLDRRPETAHVWKNCQGDEKTRLNLLASFTSHLQRFEVVAALFEKAKVKFSLLKWVKESGGILLVPNHPRYRATLGPIHRLLFDRITDEVLELPNSDQRRTFFLLDEIRSLGRVENLFHLSNEGRSKGVCLVVGSQSIEGIHQVYGEKLGNEILGQLRGKTFLRTDSHTTASWIESHIGQVQYLVEQISHSTGYSDGKTNRSTSVSHSRRRESLIFGSEIMKMATPKPGGVFNLVNDLPSLGGCFVTTYGFEQLIGGLTPPKPGVAAFVERDVQHQVLREWTAKDFKRLKFPAALAAPPAADLEVAELFTKIETSQP